ncbi:hypothetical protein BHQ19_27670 [Mycolicibacterium porcinum]|nr:hypothetical protein BHQ19_27670 [Mycolicibacterium porcinum]
MFTRQGLDVTGEVFVGHRGGGDAVPQAPVGVVDDFCSPLVRLGGALRAHLRQDGRPGHGVGQPGLKSDDVRDQSGTGGLVAPSEPTSSSTAGGRAASPPATSAFPTEHQGV